jgi:1,4-dihydroxy-2-naphthoate octaprenyltransferase
MIPRSLRLFIQLSRPIFLVGAALVYGLGAGIARYLGIQIDWGVYLLGQAWVTALQLSAHYLNEAYDGPVDSQNPQRTLFSGGSGAVGPGKLSRNVPFVAAAITLTITASLTVLLIQFASLSPLIVLIMVLSFLGAVFYSTPPIRLVSTGYGELTTSFLVANLVPAFAFLLQYGEWHRLLGMSTFPLTALHLAMMLAFELPDYATDLKYEKLTLLVRVGWQQGMFLHNILILSGFFILALATLMGMPPAVALPAFIPLLLGLLQIWQMRRISAGGKPNWNTLTLAAVVLFGSVAYLLAYAYWTR